MIDNNENEQPIEEQKFDENLQYTPPPEEQQAKGRAIVTIMQIIWGGIPILIGAFNLLRAIFGLGGLFTAIVFGLVGLTVWTVLGNIKKKIPIPENYHGDEFVRFTAGVKNPERDKQIIKINVHRHNTTRTYEFNKETRTLRETTPIENNNQTTELMPEKDFQFGEVQTHAKLGMLCPRCGESFYANASEKYTRCPRCHKKISTM